MNQDICIRLFRVGEEGGLFDYTEEYALDTFAGVVPSIGDQFINPGVEVGLDRFESTNREILKVVGRVFNIGDNGNYVGLIVDARQGQPEDQVFI